MTLLSQDGDQWRGQGKAQGAIKFLLAAVHAVKKVLILVLHWKSSGVKIEAKHDLYNGLPCHEETPS